MTSVRMPSIDARCRVATTAKVAGALSTVPLTNLVFEIDVSNR